MGSGEFEPWSGEAERFALSEATGDGTVAVLATASAPEGAAVYDRWTEKGLSHYRELGITARPVRVLGREDALDPANAGAVEAASMVFFSGGSPRFLAATLQGTPVWAAILGLLERGGVFAGCSAGAMVAGAARSPQGGGRLPLNFRSGLGLVPDTAFGVHWDRFGRWPLKIVRGVLVGGLPAGVRLIGIAENTAVVSDGDAWRVFGLGTVDVRDRGRRQTLGEGQTFPR
jgi:cyanophycinase